MIVVNDSHILVSQCNQDPIKTLFSLFSGQNLDENVDEETGGNIINMTIIMAFQGFYDYVSLVLNAKSASQKLVQGV